VLVLVVYHQYLYQVNTRESDRQELDHPGRILLVETTQTDQHNSDAQAINIPTVSTKKRE
jgi:hypothetical protein